MQSVLLENLQLPCLLARNLWANPVSGGERESCKFCGLAMSHLNFQMLQCLFSTLETENCWLRYTLDRNHGPGTEIGNVFSKCFSTEAMLSALEAEDLSDLVVELEHLLSTFVFGADVSLANSQTDLFRSMREGKLSDLLMYCQLLAPN